MKKMRKNQLAAMVLACCAAVCSFTTVQAGAINLHDEATMTEEEKQIKEYCDIVVNSINAERVERGLSELVTFPELNEVTCIRAQELTEKFEHYRPDGSLCFSVLKEAGIKYSVSAENLAGGRESPVSTVNQWMNSEGHRANILGDKFTHVGVGYYYDSNSKWEHHWSLFLIGAYDGTEVHVFDTQYAPKYDLGDVDGSHTINAQDAKKILHYASSRAAGVPVNVVSEFAGAADVNSDGVVDARDASAILAYSAAAGANGSANLEDYIW